MVRYNAGLAVRAVPEWQATLDALQDFAEIGTAGPVGYWGVSLGTAIGVPLAAAEPRPLGVRSPIGQILLPCRGSSRCMTSLARRISRWYS